MSLLSRTAAALSICTLFIAAAAAFAQTHAGRGEISGGYMFMRDTSTMLPPAPETNFPAGWYLSGAVNPTAWRGLVAEISGSYRNKMNFTSGDNYSYSRDARIYTVLAGPRFFHKAGRVAPFAQVLAGIADIRRHTTWPQQFGSLTTTSNTTAFTIQPGGGVTVHLTPHAGVRVAGDYRNIIDFVGHDDDNYIDQFRVVTGFTWEWGRR